MTIFSSSEKCILYARAYTQHTEARETVPHPATLVWEPNRMPDNKVEQFLVVAR